MLTKTGKSLYHSKIVWSYLLKTVFRNDFALLEEEIYRFLLSCLMWNTLYGPKRGYRGLKAGIFASKLCVSRLDFGVKASRGGGKGGMRKEIEKFPHIWKNRSTVLSVQLPKIRDHFLQKFKKIWVWRNEDHNSYSQAEIGMKQVSTCCDEEK